MAIKIELGKTIVLRTEQDGTGLLSYVGGIFKISEVATLILSGIYNNKKIPEIVDLILNEYDVTLEEVKTDMKEFFESLFSLEIITEEYLTDVKRELTNFV